MLEAIIRTDTTYPIRQWARRAGISHVQAGKLLAEFADLGLVHSERRGRNVEYTPNTESLIFGRLKNVDTVAVDLIPIAPDLLDAPPGSIVGIFGSIARDTLHPGSDLDVFVIDDDQGAWISTWRSAVEGAFSIAVNVLVFTRAEWEAAEHNNERIITEIRRDAVMLSGSIS